MLKQFYLLYLADGIRPLKTDKFYITSRGKAPLNNGDETIYMNFLSQKQSIGKNCLYDSNYDVFYIPVKYLKLGRVTTINDAKEIIIDGIKIYGNSGTFIEFQVVENSLYLFDVSGEYKGLLKTVIEKYGIKEIFTKIKIQEIFERIRFYFVSREIFINYFIIKEGMKYGLLGDLKGYNKFNCGNWCYVSNKEYDPLLMWPRRPVESNIKLQRTNYFEFLKHLKEIDEFNYSEGINELSSVTSMGGRFYFLKQQDKIIGIACIEKIAESFMYVSYLAIKKDYRKTNASKELIDGLKFIAKSEEKNLILTIEVSKLLTFYKSHGFKAVAQWYFD